MKKAFFIIFSFFIYLSVWAASRHSHLSVEIKIGTDMDDKTLVGQADQFSSQTSGVIGWTRISGETGPTEIQHIWIFNGIEDSSKKLKIPSTPYRTYSWKSLKGKIGKWVLIVVDKNGKLIGSKEFEILK
ncbi:MAG: DUF2914 domain-containing protein [Elusimicrobiota bacterium]